MKYLISFLFYFLSIGAFAVPYSVPSDMTLWNTSNGGGIKTYKKGELYVQVIDIQKAHPAFYTGENSSRRDKKKKIWNPRLGSKNFKGRGL